MTLRADPASPCPGCMSSRVAALAIALSSIFVHLSAGTTLATLAAGLSERSEGGGSGFQNAIEMLRLAMSLVSGWAIASALASVIGVLGVAWDYLPALRLFAIQAVADSIVWALVISGIGMVILHPALFPRLAPMLCEEITSGELASLFSLRTLTAAVPTSTSSAPGPAASQGAVTLLDVIGSFDQCVDRLRPALVFLLVLSLLALVVRARLAAAVWSLYRQRATVAYAGYAPAPSSAWSKADESAISDVGSDVETDGAATPLARSEGKGEQWLTIPPAKRSRFVHRV